MEPYPGPRGKQGGANPRGGITGGVYELGVLSALDDFLVGGHKPADVDIYVGITAKEMCKTVLGEDGHRFLRMIKKEVSLDRVSTDRFLEFVARAKSGRRFSMKHR